MDNRDFVLLEAELREYYNTIEQIYERIRQRQATFKDTSEGVDSMAYQIHNLYGAYEELFETAANFFENQIEGARYHADLLRRMKIEIEGMRPTLLSEPTYKLLDELRRFRHFFRHAYGVELDADRVNRIVLIALQLEESFRQDMESFLSRLKPINLGR